MPRPPRPPAGQPADQSVLAHLACTAPIAAGLAVPMATSDGCAAVGAPATSGVSSVGSASDGADGGATRQAGCPPRARRRVVIAEKSAGSA